MKTYVDGRPDAWLFPAELRQPITPQTLNRAWARARRTVGRPDLHLHDLRHSGLTWSAAAGATTAELMHAPVMPARLQRTGISTPPPTGTVLWPMLSPGRGRRASQYDLKTHPPSNPWAPDLS